MQQLQLTLLRIPILTQNMYSINGIQLSQMFSQTLQLLLYLRLKITHLLRAMFQVQTVQKQLNIHSIVHHVTSHGTVSQKMQQCLHSVIHMTELIPHSQLLQAHQQVAKTQIFILSSVTNVMQQRQLYITSSSTQLTPQHQLHVSLQVKHITSVLVLKQRQKQAQ